MIKIKDKTVFKYSCAMMYITIFGAFGTYIIHVWPMEIPINTVLMLNTAFDFMFNIGSGYCIIFVMVWIMNYSGLLNMDGSVWQKQK